MNPGARNDYYFWIGAARRDLGIIAFGDLKLENASYTYTDTDFVIKKNRSVNKPFPRKK